MQNFEAVVSRQGDYSLVKLSGVVDEDNGLGDLAEQIPVGTAIVDLGDIERINSCGVRDWVNWLGRLERQQVRVILAGCSPPIVAQLNLVSNFAGTGGVKSFYSPYFCPECDEEKVMLVETADMAQPPEPPTCRCDECDLVMDFDDMPESYFAFLAGRKPIADLDAIDQALRRVATAEPRERSKVRPRTSAAMGTSGGVPASVPALAAVARLATAPNAFDIAPPTLRSAPISAVPRPTREVEAAIAAPLPSGRMGLVALVVALVVASGVLVYLLIR